MSDGRFKSGKTGETTIGGVARDGYPRHNIIDTVTRAQPTIEYEHYTIHNSFHYFYTDAFSLNATTDANIKEFLIVTPTHVAGAAFAPGCHLHFEAEGSIITQFDLYEDCTRTAATTDAVTTFNNNRNSTDSAQLKVYTPVISTTDTADGTLLYTFKGGTSTAQFRAGDSGDSAQEIVLKKNAKYLMRFTSSSASNLCDLYLNWYELDAYS